VERIATEPVPQPRIVPVNLIVLLA